MSQEIEITITQLEAWRDRITTTIETLRYFLTQGAGLPSSLPPGTGGARAVSETEIRHDAFFQMTIPDAAEKYLSIVKQTKPNTALSEGLLKGGLKTAAKNFSETVRAIVSRDDRFVKVNGEWGLSAWYPAMKRERKQRANTEAGETDINSKETDKATKGGGSKVAPKTRPTAENPDSGGAISQRILRLLDESPNEVFTPKEIADALNERSKTVRAALFKFVRKGSVEKPSEGRYQSKKRAA